MEGATRRSVSRGVTASVTPNVINSPKSRISSSAPQPQLDTNTHGQSPAHLGGIGTRDKELGGEDLGSGKGIGKGKERG